MKTFSTVNETRPDMMASCSFPENTKNNDLYLVRRRDLAKTNLITSASYLDTNSRVKCSMHSSPNIVTAHRVYPYTFIYALRHPAEKQSKRRTGQGPTRTTTTRICHGHSGEKPLCPWRILVVVVFVGPCPVRFLLCFSAGWRSAYLAGGSAFRPLWFVFVVFCAVDLPSYMTTGVHVDVILNGFFSCKDRASERDRPYERKKNKRNPKD